MWLYLFSYFVHYEGKINTNTEIFNGDEHVAFGKHNFYKVLMWFYLFSYFVHYGRKDKYKY
jgi:uncharacterized protein Smg (DUF494 family)